jgi:hypothetical protein
MAKDLADAKQKEIEKRTNLIKDEASLYWKILVRQPEVGEGTVQLLKDTFLKNFETSYSGFNPADDEAFKEATHKLLLSSGRFRIIDVKDFVARVAKAFQKEQMYRKDRRNHFSLDILFQTIDFLSAGKPEEAAEQNLVDKHDDGLTIQERENLIINYRAYNAMNAKILGLGNLKDALFKKDIIVSEVALLHKDITITALEFMFRNIIAQQLLSKKYNCDTLINEWGKEYNFDDDLKTRVLSYISGDTPLLKFRPKYAQAIQAIKNTDVSKSNVLDSDLFLLRSLANFYTSWIMQVSEMIAA